MQLFINKYALVLLTVFAFTLRFWGVGDVPSYTEDEGLNIREALHYTTTGNFFTTSFYQPPLKQVLYYASIRMFGDNPYGWRMVNVLCGTLIVLFIMLLSQELIPDKRVAVLAGLFAAVEPLLIYYSRTAFGEIPALFFTLLYLYGIVRYLKGSDGALWLAGAALGCALAVKWYLLVPSLAVTAFVILCRALDHGWRWSTLINAAAGLLFLPAALYALTYYPWFGRGFGFMEFIQWQITCYQEQQIVQLADFPQTAMILKSGSFLSWFLKPVLFGYRTGIGDGWSRYQVYMNTFPVWVLFFPATGWFIYRIVRQKDRILAAAALLFLVLYLQFFLVQRPLFFYSSMQLLPFVYLVVAFFILTGLQRVALQETRIFTGILVGILAWGLYLYPVVIGRPVPDALYGPVLSFGDIDHVQR